MKNVITKRFNYIDICELSFPLKHPQCILFDPSFEKWMEQIIIQPFVMRLKIIFGSKIKKCWEYLLK